MGMGFKAPGDKTGTVDIAKIFKDSDYAVKQTATLQTEVRTRQQVMEFIRTNRNMKPEDAQKLRELSVKESPSDADKAELTRIKTDAQASEATVRGLQTAAQPTPAQLSQMDDFNKRKDATGQLLEKWQADFSNEIQVKQEKMTDDTMQRVKDAIALVGREQGYSLVLAQNIAPYSANDITADALKAMNNKK